MKKLFILTTGLLIFFAFAWTVKIDSKSDELIHSTKEIYAIHDLEVKEGVDLQEFEKYVMDLIAPIYNKMKGQTFILVKGDRGMRTGQYSIILTFDSIKDRDRIYPPSGELVGDFGSQENWDEFYSMLDNVLGESHTDYVRVMSK